MSGHARDDRGQLDKLISSFFDLQFFLWINCPMQELQDASYLMHDVVASTRSGVWILTRIMLNNVLPRVTFFSLSSLSFSMIVNYLWYAIVRSSSFRAPLLLVVRGWSRQGEHSGEENNKESRRAISAVSCYRILLFANRWMSGWIDRPRLRPRRHGPRSPINPAGFLLTGVKS